MFPGTLSDLVNSVRQQGLEDLVAKRRNSVHEPGLRSGAWQKTRINQGQEFVIGEYTIGGATFDALVFGYYEDDRLMYVSRTRNGFTPAIRATIQAVQAEECCMRRIICQRCREPKHPVCICV
jgi:ATP-dependent DNA ligase